MVKEKIRECRVCDKKIKIVTTQHIVIKGKGIYGKKTQETFSEDGILFHRSFMDGHGRTGVWFCNSCWAELTKKIKWK